MDGMLKWAVLDSTIEQPEGLEMNILRGRKSIISVSISVRSFSMKINGPFKHFGFPTLP